MSEFSSENIFCLLEITQFMNLSSQQFSIPLSFEDTIIFPNDPSFISKTKSSIVSDESTSLIDKIISIYDKYLSRSSEYEVNLPWGTRQYMRFVCDRQELEAKLKDGSKNEEIVFIFKQVLEDLLELMRDSYMRCKGTERFFKVLELR